jgi:alginate O-acetyltransferase complex protein AlgI
MVFNSVEFLLFFIVVTAFFYALPHKLRWPLLLGASCFFYMFFKPVYILILFFTITIDYWVGLLLEWTERKKRKKLILLGSIIANVGVLAVFKYYNFIITNLEVFLNLRNHTCSFPHLDILLPIGLSFHTFQAMSYTIEVYRGNFKAERNYGIYALYVMFYPQLVAGPIERPQNVLPQLRQYHRFDPVNFANGLKLILWGLFKKVVIADNLSEFVNMAYKKPAAFSGLSVIVACIFFSFQIYCDFSGYSDIALGTAKVMGINLMRNFERPYLSESISEFWSHWHISLSTWFRDYVYIPLGGNRASKNRTYFNQMTVFLLSGLWHGASWTFVVWGALHGSFVIFESLVKRYFPWLRLGNNPIVRLGKKTGVFIIVSFAWVFFRARDFSNVHDILYRVTHCRPGDFKASLFNGENPYILWVSVILTIGLILFEVTQKEKSFLDLINDWSKPARRSFLMFLIITMLLLGAFHNSSEFIYFQF